MNYGKRRRNDMSLLDALNEPQRQAVMATDGPLLILAGAGSGKTRVLTHRTAYLIEECGVNPYNIMAITFTNKAAGEMRERIDQMVGYGSESIWVCTFHSTCVRILRRYIDRLGFGTNFTIYDSDDQKTLMKDICKRLEIDTKMYKEKMFLSAISSAKDELIDPIEFETRAAGDYVKRKQAQVYREYQQALKQNNALDFDDLIMKTVELFKLDKEVLASYQDRLRYIMVDEYQDTNTAQFELIRLLALKCDTQFVDVIGTSKGKGFQGVVKRHGFGGVGQSTHGQDDRLRKPGSIGACSYPAKVFKGLRMGGQMGGDRVTTQNLKVLKVIPEHNLLLIKGSVPGCKGSIVIIEK